MNNCVFFLICYLLTSCSHYGQLEFVAKLPKKIGESSGSVYLSDSTLWVINDSGGADKLYQLNFKGELLREIKIGNAKNRDWEDLAQDNEGNIYIADIGNNGNDRKNLVIYKVPPPHTVKGDKAEAEKIKFEYPEQRKFPPKKEKLKFDAEAVFFRDGYIYLITKNKANPFDGEALIYKIPAKKGEYEAELVGRYVPCEQFYSCRITAADISPDGKKIVLLSYGKLWVFTDFDQDDFTQGKLRFIDIGATTQLESVSFMDDETLLLTDEYSAASGGNLYSFRLNKDSSPEK